VSTLRSAGEIRDANAVVQTVSTLVVTVGLKVVGAVVVFIIGRRLIDLSLRLVANALTKQHVAFRQRV